MPSLFSGTKSPVNNAFLPLAPAGGTEDPKESLPHMHSKAPAASYSGSRRQHILKLVYRFGSSIQRAPVHSTQRIPSRHLRVIGWWSSAIWTLRSPPYEGLDELPLLICEFSPRHPYVAYVGVEE
jgi:hypothetical protein